LNSEYQVPMIRRREYLYESRLCTWNETEGNKETGEFNSNTA